MVYPLMVNLSLFHCMHEVRHNEHDRVFYVHDGV